jgi:ribonuclease BN (tRNA processing enzyme)
MKRAILGLIALLLASPALADPTLILLGTAGGPPPHKDRSQPAAALVIDGKTYLIDAGENAGQQLVRADLPLPALHAVLLTHLHWDHTMGLDYILATGWMMGRTAPLTVYGPPGTDQLLARDVAAVSLGEAIFRPQMPGRPPLASLYVAKVLAPADPAPVEQDGAVRITKAANSHFGPGANASYAYRFDYGAHAVVFTGDTGPSPAVTALARGADMLVSEICDMDSIRAALVKTQPGADITLLMQHMEQQHLSPEAVGRMAAEAGVKTLVLTHFVMGPGFDPAGFVAKIRPFFSGTIVVGQDLQRIPLAN